jgi:hypothetical protein
MYSYVLTSTLTLNATTNQALTVGDKSPSVDAWQKALDLVSKENLSPAELKQKQQYTASLTAAKRPRIIRMSNAAGKMPWDCAKAIKPELLARKEETVASSVSIGCLVGSLTKYSFILD